MDPTFEAFLQSWPFDPWLIVPLVLSACLYFRGWLELRARGSSRFDKRHLLAFLGGLFAIFVALGSPIDPFAALLLQVHMVQHMLLMVVAPPLLYLGAPTLPLLRGLPRGIRHHWVAPVLRLHWVRGAFHFLTHPAVAWLLFMAANWIWHIPHFYEAALRSDAWHYAEHVSFLGTGLLFWWPVVQPYPSRPRFSRWLMLPYLIGADVASTPLAAILAFAPRSLYPYYDSIPRLWGMSPLENQGLAAAIMWVPGSLAFLLPVVVTGARLLYGKQTVVSGQWSVVSKEPASGGVYPRRPDAGRISLPLASGTRSSEAKFDLLWVPLLGQFLKWRHARLALQIPLFLLAAAIIFDGLTGPQAAPMNLAGVLPWIHWRGLLVLGLLVAGNVFCMACPFMLPRKLGKKLLPARWAWPQRLRGKWLALVLLAIFFWAYETFALWASPWWTAWIALGYFLAAFVIDGWFRGAAFCKYVCPIGQFNFVQSLVSPLEIQVREPAICRSCTTKECIRGSASVPGCELQLYPPRKSGNMDCTLCLDCVHACPHGNLALTARAPGAELLHDRQRSGIGRFGRRPDLAALVLLLVFAAFVNAAGMVAPVVEMRDRLAAALGLTSPLLVVTGSYVLALLVLPLALIAIAARLGGWWSGDPAGSLELATRFAYALVPLGFGMWLAHYGFHLFTSAGTVLPVSQRFLGDWGSQSFGAPEWACSCCTVPVASWLLRLEIVFLDLGLVLSLYLAYRIAEQRHPRWTHALKLFAPWAVLMLLLFAAGTWILFQPMEMRGTMGLGG